MTDLIDRQKLLKDIEQYHLSDGKFQHWVEVQPSADAVEVERCEDCIWRYHDVIDGEETDWCAVWANETELDAFCKYGKGRRNDD